MLLAKFKFGSCKRDFISSTNFEDKINILIKRGRVDLQSKKKKKNTSLTDLSGQTVVYLKQEPYLNHQHSTQRNSESIMAIEKRFAVY